MKKLNYLLIALGALMIMTTACNRTKTMTDNVKTPTVKTPAVKTAVDKMSGGVGIDLSLMDPSVRPQDDFFRYVNGAWLDKAEIPADRGRWGSFDELRKKSSKAVLEVLEEAIAAGSYGKGTDQ